MPYTFAQRFAFSSSGSVKGIKGSSDGSVVTCITDLNTLYIFRFDGNTYSLNKTISGSVTEARMTYDGMYIFYYLHTNSTTVVLKRHDNL